jgi:hypothetical protein
MGGAYSFETTAFTPLRSHLQAAANGGGQATARTCSCDRSHRAALRQRLSSSQYCGCAMTEIFKVACAFLAVIAVLLVISICCINYLLSQLDAQDVSLALLRAELGHLVRLTPDGIEHLQLF